MEDMGMHRSIRMSLERNMWIESKHVAPAVSEHHKHVIFGMFTIADINVTILTLSSDIEWSWILAEKLRTYYIFHTHEQAKQQVSCGLCFQQRILREGYVIVRTKKI